jgi:hypothetical protein
MNPSSKRHQSVIETLCERLRCEYPLQPAVVDLGYCRAVGERVAKKDAAAFMK